MKENGNQGFHGKSEEETKMSVIEEQLRAMQREGNDETDDSYSLSDALHDMQDLGKDLKDRGLRSFQDVQRSVKEVRKYLHRQKG